MIGFKNVFTSKTILASIVGAVFALLSAFGIVETDPQLEASIVAALFALAGFFRFQATEQLVVSKT